VAQRLIALVGMLAIATAGCRSSQPAVPVPAPTAPLPTAGLAGQKVTVYPLTLLSADEALGWDTALTPHTAALHRADSIMGALLTERSPEVTWVLPNALRRAAARAPGLLTDPDHMATAILRAPNVRAIPDPLRSQMRDLTGVAGERYALVPTALVFVPDSLGGGEAELDLVIVDVRTGTLGWRTIARGDGTTPWSALRAAFKKLTPGLP
jgi:hypothetical protein